MCSAIAVSMVPAPPFLFKTPGQTWLFSFKQLGTGGMAWSGVDRRLSGQWSYDRDPCLPPPPKSSCESHCLRRGNLTPTVAFPF